MKMNILVIHERDRDDNERRVIGVADSVENAEKIFKEYYGEFKEITHNDIRDSNLEYSKVLEVLDCERRPYRVDVWLEWFELNCI